MLTKKEILLYNYMKDILETHPVTNLKSILRNIKGDIGSYSKMKKAELINRIMELKKKGFPVPKVEKYVKPERKKPEKKSAPVQAPRNLVKGFGIKRTEKKPEPKEPEPNKSVVNMNTKEYSKYLKQLPKKIPNVKDTKAVDDFLKAHEGIGYAWQFHKGKSANDEFLFEVGTQNIYNRLSKANKLKFLDLYINKTNDQLRSQLANPKGLSKPLLVQYVYDKPNAEGLKKLEKENRELYTELENRYSSRSKILKSGDKEGIEKAKKLLIELNDNNNKVFVYGGDFISKRNINKLNEEIRKEPEALKRTIDLYEKEVEKAKSRAKRAGREYNEAKGIGVSNVLKRR